MIRTAGQLDVNEGVSGCGLQNTVVELQDGGACFTGLRVCDFEIRVVVTINTRVGIKANSAKKYPAIVEEYERAILIGAYILKPTPHERFVNVQRSSVVWMKLTAT